MGASFFPVSFLTSRLVEDVKDLFEEEGPLACPGRWIGANFCLSWNLFLSILGSVPTGEEELEDTEEQSDRCCCSSFGSTGARPIVLTDDPGRLVPSRNPQPEKANGRRGSWGHEVEEEEGEADWVRMDWDLWSLARKVTPSGYSPWSSAGKKPSTRSLRKDRLAGSWKIHARKVIFSFLFFYYYYFTWYGLNLCWFSSWNPFSKKVMDSALFFWKQAPFPSTYFTSCWFSLTRALRSAMLRRMRSKSISELVFVPLELIWKGSAFVMDLSGRPSYFFWRKYKKLHLLAANFLDGQF